MYEGLQTHDFVSNLHPREPSIMSRDELQGSADTPRLAPLREVGMCRDCGCDMPYDEWIAKSKRCQRC
jgi:hypothetical protein